MQTLIRHRIPNSDDQLVLDDWENAKFIGENPGRFSVAYLESTIDWSAEDGKESKKCFNYCMSQHFHDYNEALRIFRLRRDSAKPFNPYKE